MNEPELYIGGITCTSPLITQYMFTEVYKGAHSEGTNLWVFENLIFFLSLLKEDFVLAVPRPG